MNTRGRTFRAFAAALGVLAAPASAFAIRLPGRAAADKAAVEPLRRADIPATLDGRADESWRAALAELPDRCRRVDVPTGNDCDDQARCAWLGARAAVLADGGAVRADAALALHRAAQRLGIARCNDDRWTADARAAALDDAAVLLAQLRRSSPIAGGPVLDGDDQRLANAVLSAAQGGIATVDPASLLAARDALGRLWSRRNWLASQPALARLREALPALWGGPARLPARCGADLLRVDLLEDQWRGYLVREVVPQAMDCLADRAATGGATLAGAETAALAKSLAQTARADGGGRRFGSDPQVEQQVIRLTEAIRGGAERAATRPAPASATAPPRSVGGSSPALAAARGAARPAPAPAALSVPGDMARRAEPARTSGTAETGPDAGLERLAARIGQITGDSDQAALSARRAGSAAERAQVERALLVGLHRAVCAPLGDADPDDLDAARRIVAAHRVPLREEACHAGEGRAALLDLLGAAPGLRRAGAAVRIRSAARLLAVKRTDEARRQLDLVPEAFRGTTWTIVAAWAAREAQDPVTASRILARIDAETLERLRSSGDEDVARLVTHAYAARP